MGKGAVGAAGAATNAAWLVVDVADEDTAEDGGADVVAG